MALHPLEVADGDAAGVGEDVGHDGDAALGEDLVGLGGGRAVGAFDDDLGLRRGRRCRAVIWRFHRGGDEHVAGQLEQLVVGDRARRRGSRRACRARASRRDAAAMSRPSASVDAALDVADGDDLRAALASSRAAATRRRCRSPGPRRAAPASGLPSRSSIASSDVHDAAAGRLLAADGAADAPAACRSRRRAPVADHHAVGVHEPGHDLRSSVPMSGAGMSWFGPMSGISSVA